MVIGELIEERTGKVIAQLIEDEPTSQLVKTDVVMLTFWAASLLYLIIQKHAYNSPFPSARSDIPYHKKLGTAHKAALAPHPTSIQIKPDHNHHPLRPRSHQHSLQQASLAIKYHL